MTWQQVKIVDFGFARLVPEKDAELKVICGTPEFMAPEVLNFDPVCFKSDIWWVMKCKRAFNFSGAERHKQAHETARVCTFLKMGQTRPRFAYFCSFRNYRSICWLVNLKPALLCVPNAIKWYCKTYLSSTQRGREPWTSGCGRRLVCWMLWVRIPAPFIGWTFFHKNLL